MNLRKRLIRLAHQKPELRPHLIPILKQAAAPEKVLKMVGNYYKREYGLTPVFDAGAKVLNFYGTDDSGLSTGDPFLSFGWTFQDGYFIEVQKGGRYFSRTLEEANSKDLIREAGKMTRGMWFRR